MRLLIFGASITAYRGSLEIAAFQVSDRLRERGVDHVFFNSGVPGNTTSMARDRFERDVLGLYPDRVLLSLGTNDSMLDVQRGKTTPRVSTAEYAANLHFFARELRQRDIQTIFLTIPPLYMTDRLRAIYGRPPYTEKGFNFMVRKYVAIMKSVAAAEAIPCLDVHHAFWMAAGGEEERLPSLYLDGMHPNRAGQTLIAREILAWLEAEPARVAGRSAYADRVAHLEVVQPRAHSRHPSGVVPFRLRTNVPGKGRVQYRCKSYSGAPQHFGPWRDVAAAAGGDGLRGGVEHAAAGTCAFQFRLLDREQAVTAVGGVEHIMLTAD